MVLKEKGHCVRRALKLSPRQSICLRNSSVITDWVVADFCVSSPQVHSVLAYFSSETADPVPRQGRERGLLPIPIFTWTVTLHTDYALNASCVHTNRESPKHQTGIREVSGVRVERNA